MLYNIIILNMTYNNNMNTPYTDKYIHNHWIFADDTDDSPVLPYLIRRSGSNFLVLKDNNKILVSTFEEACAITNDKFKKCPMSGRLVPTGFRNVKQLCRYLKHSHLEVFNELESRSNGNIKTLYVNSHGYSTTYLHPEIKCKYGLECHGLTGCCSFNHDTIWCKYEISPTLRCKSIYCCFDHGRGRVLHDNIFRKKANNTIK